MEESGKSRSFIVKEEIKEEEDDMFVKEEISGHKDLYKDIMVENQPPLTSPDGSSNGNPPERCPRPLYSRVSTQEDHTISHHHQGKKLMDVKVEFKEEKYVVGNGLPTMKKNMSDKEESSLNINTDGRYILNNSENQRTLSPDCNTEDNGFASNAPGINPITENQSRLMDPSSSKPRSPGILPSSSTGEKIFPCPQCDKCFDFKHRLVRHLMVHTGERPYICSDCGKSYARKLDLLTHAKIHTGERPFTCTACGKGFIEKKRLAEHERVHTSERPFLCTVCGKSFEEKRHLIEHERLHAGERPFSCTVCGKGFGEKRQVIEHERLHTGEKLFSCTVCGQRFRGKKVAGRTRATAHR